MRREHQLVVEFMNSGDTLPVDVAMRLIDDGIDISLIEDQIEGFDIIDTTDVDYFEHIDNNH